MRTTPFQEPSLKVSSRRGAVGTVFRTCVSVSPENGAVSHQSAHFSPTGRLVLDSALINQWCQFADPKLHNDLRWQTLETTPDMLA